MLSIITSPHTVQHRKLAFEIFHLFAHHRQVQLNVMLMTADDSQEVELKLIQHLNVQQTTASTLKTTITIKQICYSGSPVSYTHLTLPTIYSV